MEAGQAVLQAHRQADEAQGDQPRDRLPRHAAGRAVDHRHPGRARSGSSRSCPVRTRCANTNFYRAPEHGDDLEAFGRWAADQIERAIEMEGPDTVAAVFVEPVQNSGGCFPPPPGYFQRVREICDRTTCCWSPTRSSARSAGSGTMFACDKFGYVPDIITCAKGMTSGYSPIGAAIVSDRIAEPFWTGDDYFPHGYTFGGHPVSAAVAMANLDIFEREGLNQHVLQNEGAFRATLEKLHRPADRRRRPRRRLLLRHRAGQGQGDQGDVRRRRVRAAAARLPVPGAVRGRPLLPRRRPRRPGRAARAAADHRPAGVRRDRADPARGPHRGVVAPLIAVLGISDRRSTDRRARRPGPPSRRCGRAGSPCRRRPRPTTSATAALIHAGSACLRAAVRVSVAVPPRPAADSSAGSVSRTAGRQAMSKRRLEGPAGGGEQEHADRPGQQFTARGATCRCTRALVKPRWPLEPVPGVGGDRHEHQSGERDQRRQHAEARAGRRPRRAGRPSIRAASGTAAITTWISRTWAGSPLIWVGTGISIARRRTGTSTNTTGRPVRVQRRALG